MGHVIDALDMDLRTLSSDERQKRQDEITLDRLLVSLRHQGAHDPRFHTYKHLLNASPGGEGSQNGALQAAAEQMRTGSSRRDGKAKTLVGKKKGRNVFIVQPNELSKYKIQKSESVRRKKKLAEVVVGGEEVE